MLFKFLILVSFIGRFDCQITYLDETKINCLALNLQAESFLKQNFLLLKDTKLTSTDCTSILPNYKKNLRNLLLTKLKVEDPGKFECLAGQFMEACAFEYFVTKNELKLPTKNTFETFVKDRERFNEKMKQYIRSATRKCDQDPAFGEIFLEIFEMRKNLTEKYCFAKYVVEKNVIQDKIVNIYPMNTLNIKLSDINCEPIITLKKLEEEFKSDSIRKELLNELEIQCIKSKIEEFKVFDLRLALQLLEEARHVGENILNKQNIWKKLELFKQDVKVCLYKINQGIAEFDVEEMIEDYKKGKFI